ncbi:hypothetical protein J4423_04080 [Candidatus Pacearchaeota archaeon]|nr:hypothetical protein [Candidatus Pacearchaeota archaeon]
MKQGCPENSISTDLTLSVIAVPFGLLSGYLSAWVYPTAVPHLINKVRGGEIRDFCNLLFYGAALDQYMGTVGGFAYNLMKDGPKTLEDYLPLITNGVVATFMICNKIRKSLSRSNLEAIV